MITLCVQLPRCLIHYMQLYLANAQRMDADFEVAGKNIDDVA
jgi:hypothetical protein